MLNKERIKKDGIKLIEEFSEMLKDIPRTDETHYVVNLKNIIRTDEKPKKTKNFRQKMKRIAPKWDNNYIVAERGGR